MSLDYDLRKVDAAIRTDAEWPVTQAIIFLTMSIGMGEITATNVFDFAVRVHAAEAVMGPWVHTMSEGAAVPRPITVADIRARIGLKTNVFPKWSDAKFRKALADRILSDAGDDVRREQKDDVRREQKAVADK